MFEINSMTLTITGRIGVTTLQITRERSVKNMDWTVIFSGIAAAATTTYAAIEIIKVYRMNRPFITLTHIDDAIFTGPINDNYDVYSNFHHIRLLFYSCKSAYTVIEIKSNHPIFCLSKQIIDPAGQPFDIPNHELASSLPIDTSLRPSSVSVDERSFDFWVKKDAVNNKTTFKVRFKREQALFKATQDISKKITHIIKQND